MRLVTYGARGNGWRAGVERDGQVVDVTALDGSFPASVKALLEGGPSMVDAVFEQAARYLDAGTGVETVTASDLGPPIPDPDKIIMLGLNYRDHAIETNMPIPEVPVLFAKFRNSLTGPYAPIVALAKSHAIDYEVELAVVIGRRCKDVDERDALRYVAGYSVMDDVSARDLQLQVSQWTAGKAIDTFAPMGPGLVPASAIPDPQALRLATRVNGRTLQNGTTADMIFTVAYTVAYLSAIMTLEPGDIIATGTPAGVGFTRKPQVLLKPGDVVECEIERVGTIRNEVVAAGTAAARSAERREVATAGE